ncbi:MAG: DNA-3-methyladenine glycosylase I [Pseudomonadales bacterium]
MKNYQWISEHVAARKRKEDMPAILVPVKEVQALAQLSDAEVFSTMTRRVFRAGLKHSLVDAKWPAFEKAFWGFEPFKVALMSDEQLENLMQNTDIIRHWGKIKATRLNAFMVDQLAQREGSFATYIANWPSQDIVGLWAQLKKEGSHLGGNSGAAFLRMLGKDTFMLTDDVVTALKAQGIVDKRPTSKRDLNTVQDAFNTWHTQSGGVPYAHISRMLACTIGY